MKSLEFLSDRYKASNPSNASNIKMEEYIQSETTSSMDAESLSKEPLRKIASKEDTESNYSACFLSREREGKERFKRLRLEHDDIIDEDYHFLVSLLPSMRALPQKRKNVVRSKVLQILCEENV